MYSTPSPHTARYRFWRRVVVYSSLAAMMCLLALLACIRRSALYDMALTRALGHPVAAYFLGFPVSSSLWVRGGLQTLGWGDTAEFSIPIAGPKDHGAIYVYAVWRETRWKFKVFELNLEESGRTINLLR